MNKTLLLFVCLVYAQINFGKIMKKKSKKLTHKKVYFNFLQTNSAKINTKNNFHSFLETSRSLSPIEDPFYFFNTEYENNLAKLPKSGSMDKMPWSSWSYPAKFGYISVRYNLYTKNGIGVFDTQNSNFTKIYNYSESIKSYSQPAEYLKTDRSQLQNVIEQNYSPSEKLDFLVGDYNFTLTNYLKDYALNLGDNIGDLPEWMGISNGWAIASQTYKKPINPVTLTAADGTKVRFLPDDIMAIASMYYATVPSSTNYVGGVCASNAPNSANADSATGLYTDPMCSTVNPATLYMILSRGIGIKNMHINIDPSVGPQVWNNPVYSYQFDYFNIQTNQTYTDYQQAKVAMTLIKKINNPFFNFISSNVDNRTVSYVGVKFNVNFAVLNFPYHLDYAEQNANYTATYEGVIEVDANDNIVGGEWRQNYHPNLLWKNDERFPPEGCCDNMTDPFNGKVTDSLTSAMIQASSQGQILKSIVEYLITQSTKNVVSIPTPSTPHSTTGPSSIPADSITRPPSNVNTNTNNAYAPISTVSLPNSNTNSASDTNTYNRPSDPTANSNSNTSRPSSNSNTNRPSSNTSSNSNTNGRPSSNSSSNSNTSSRPSTTSSSSSYSSNTPSSSNTNLNSLRNYYGDPSNSNGSSSRNTYTNNDYDTNNYYNSGSNSYSNNNPSNFISNTLNNIRRSIDSSDIFNLFDDNYNFR